MCAILKTPAMHDVSPKKFKKGIGAKKQISCFFLIKSCEPSWEIDKTTEVQSTPLQEKSAFQKNP